MKFFEYNKERIYVKGNVFFNIAIGVHSRLYHLELTWTKYEIEPFAVISFEATPETKNLKAKKILHRIYNFLNGPHGLMNLNSLERGV